MHYWAIFIGPICKKNWFLNLIPNSPKMMLWKLVKKKYICKSKKRKWSHFDLHIFLLKSANKAWIINNNIKKIYWIILYVKTKETIFISVPCKYNCQTSSSLESNLTLTFDIGPTKDAMNFLWKSKRGDHRTFSINLHSTRLEGGSVYVSCHYWVIFAAPHNVNGPQGIYHTVGWFSHEALVHFYY